MMRIAIFALQGAFAEHEQMLRHLNVASSQIRNIKDWQDFINTADGSKKGIILPGGESTAMMKILHDEGLFEPLKSAIEGGMPVFGTCAGMILLGKSHLGCMDVTVKRNAYGRQLGSFHTTHEMKGLGVIPMTFIRAPYIESYGKDVEILSELNGHAVAAKQANMLITSFHPELTVDSRVHELFLNIVKGI